MKPQDWRSFSEKDFNGLKGVCLDIDDTLSTSGKLTSEAFQALWSLSAAGFEVVPITGRPAGWCDHIARFWPVTAVIGENGAFAFFMENKVRVRMDTPGLDRNYQEKLAKLGTKIKQKFPKAVWASDQNYRECDLAIDFCEDVQPWKEKEVSDLVSLCTAEGAKAKVSSIHVNTWFGSYDKKTGFENWRKEKSQIQPTEWIFIGDSPNDEPMFEYFQNSVGVANLNRFLGQIQHPPKWITASESGLGFVEFSKKLCEFKTV